MPRQGGSPALPQKPEPVIELRHGFLNAISIGATGGEFYRQSNSIEFATDFADNRCIIVTQFEIASAGAYAFDEKLHRRKNEGLRRSKICICGRAIQRRQPMDMLSLDTQGLPTGR